MDCKHCSKEFEPKRADARYCSTKCRVSASRNNKRNTETVTDNVTDKLSVTPAVTDNPATVTDKLSVTSQKEKGKVFISPAQKFIGGYK